MDTVAYIINGPEMKNTRNLFVVPAGAGETNLFSTGIRTFSFSKEKPFCYPQPGYYHFLFVLEGGLQCLSDSGSCLSLKKGQFTFLSQQEIWELRGIEYPCRLVLFSFVELPDAAEKYYFRSLLPYTREQKYSLSVHKTEEPLESYLRMVLGYLEDGIPMEKLSEIKLKELFLLLKHFYLLPELVTLFHPLICRLDHFRQAILDNWRCVSNSRELIRLMNMRRSSFERRFRKEFGCSAHQWLLRQRADQVQKSLADPDITIEEVRRHHHFNSATHFVRFCRSQFGCTPTDLGKRLLSEKVEPPESPEGRP